MENLSEARKQELLQEIADIRQKAEEARRRKRMNYRIDQYRDAIEAFRQNGATINEILMWLKQKKLSASRATLYRSLKRWHGNKSAANASFS